MKTTQRLFATTLLTVVFAAPALAGDMFAPSNTLPPSAPAPPPGHGRVAAPPVNQSPRETACMSDLLTEAALFVCQRMLALL
jgi:hypothetical protein